MIENRTTRHHFNEHGVPKRGYATKVEAVRWAALLHAVGETANLMNSYQCGICGDWHLGNGPDTSQE